MREEVAMKIGLPESRVQVSLSLLTGFVKSINPRNRTIITLDLCDENRN